MPPLQHHVAAFYRFVPLEDVAMLRARVLSLAQSHQLIGTILLADEGINATLAAKERGQLESFFDALGLEQGLAQLPIKWSTAPHAPFDHLFVKHKKEIVTLGRPVDPRRRVGRYVPPSDWNELISEPGVVLIDARNDYEVRVGAFEGAIDPKTPDFRALPAWMDEHLDPNRHTRVAMYCTGGIRCEKATSLLMERGFQEVYHLEGGILAYLERVPERESRFRGACFVFDQRVSLAHGLVIGEHQICADCGEPFLRGTACAACAASDVAHEHDAEQHPGRDEHDREQPKQDRSHDRGGPLHDDVVL